MASTIKQHLKPAFTISLTFSSILSQSSTTCKNLALVNIANLTRRVDSVGNHNNKTNYYYGFGF